jgi:hypothetical protein
VSATVLAQVSGDDVLSSAEQTARRSAGSNTVCIKRRLPPLDRPAGDPAPAVLDRSHTHRLPISEGRLVYSCRRGQNRDVSVVEGG